MHKISIFISEIFQDLSCVFEDVDDDGDDIDDDTTVVAAIVSVVS